MIGFPQHTELLTRLMEVSDMRHRVVSQNLANVNTPGYRRLTVNFEDELAKEILSGSGADLTREPEIVPDNSRPARADGNNVDVDLELGELQRNAMLYQTYAQLLAAQFATMRMAIRTQ
jgi:flagellar basal-body rod protein FlgB